MHYFGVECMAAVEFSHGLNQLASADDDQVDCLGLHG
jgi:hypothetical protein